MQKQSNSSYVLKQDGYTFPEDFPIGGIISGTHVPSAGPVTFLHYHDFLEIGYCYEGAGLFFIDNMILPFSQGDVCVILKNQMHIAQSCQSDPSCWRFLYLEPEKLLLDLGLKSLYHITEALSPREGFVPIIKKSEYPDIHRLVLLLIEELQNKKERYQDIARGLVWSLVISIGRIKGISDNGMFFAQHNDMSKVMPAIEYISANYVREIHIEELAKVCCMSVPHFRKVFKAVMSLSPLEYITQVRIQMACILLDSTDKPVTEVSYLTGFMSLCNFNRRFKAVTNTSPSGWRKRRQNTF